MNVLQIVLSVVLGVLLLIGSGEAIECAICDTSEDGWDCLSRPPPPKECMGYDFCIDVSKFTPNGKLLSFTRSCSPFALPQMCVPGLDKHTGVAVQLCYATCSRPGCNSGHSLHQLLDLLRRRK